jgi:ubiquinone/menaquinone biosynthesis C-methylase UbiE
MENKMVSRFAEGKVLDIGCGTGYHMSHSWFRNAGIDVTGIDASDEMLKAAENAAGRRGIKTKKARAERLPFRDNDFDTVFCFFAVLNMCDSGQTVREMSRVLKPGGCALLSLSSIHDKRHFKISKQKVELRRLFTKDGLVGLFEKNGFSLEHFDSVFRTRRPRWGDFSRVPLRERASLWMDRFRPVENGVVYMAAFRKVRQAGKQ